MNDLAIIDNSIAIKNTIGFAIFDDINEVNHPAIISFCKIVDNYNNMCRIDEQSIQENN